MRRLRLILALMLACAGAVRGAHAWQNNDFGKRIQCTVPSPDGDLTAHPFPIKLDGRSIVDTDIVDAEWCVYDHNDSLLDWEKEAYAEAGGTCTGIIWTVVDQYSAPAGEQNIVWFYYNKISGATPGNTPTDVWDGDFKGVWHMTGANQAAIDDSTSNSNDTSAEGGNPTYDQAAEIANGVDFDGTGDALEVPDDNTLDMTSALTISTWINRGVGSGWRTVLAKLETTSTKSYWLTIAGSSGDLSFFRSTDGSDQDAAVADTVVPTGAFTHIAVSYDASNARFYHNGAADGAPALVGNCHVSASPLELGSLLGMTADFLLALLDEVRISASIRSADWIAQEFQVVDTGLTYAAIESKPAAVGIPMHLHMRSPHLNGGHL